MNRLQNKINEFVFNKCSYIFKKIFKSNYDEIKSKYIIIRIIKYTYFLIIMIFLTLLLNVNFNKNERTQIKEIKYNDFINDDYYIDLDLKINDEIRNVKIKAPKKDPNDEEIVDRILNVLNQNVIKGENKSLNNVVTNLDLITKNSYGALVTWESEKGYINISDGSVIAPYKGEGNYKDTLILKVEYKDIKKVKEFTVVIPEQKITVDENNIDQIFEEINKGHAYNGNKLLNKLNEYDLVWFVHENEKKNNSLSLIIISLLIYFLALYNEFYKCKKENKRQIEMMENEFVTLIEDYYLLELAGYNLTNALLFIEEKYNKNNDFKKLLEQLINKIKLGFNTFDAFEHFGKDTKSIKIQKIIKEIIIKLKRDESDLDLFLKDKINELNKNKKLIYENNAEENNIKALLPLIIILISTMIIVVYPAIVAMDF